MHERTVSSREFNQDPSGVKRAADEGPVLITHRGEVSHVLLAIDDYRRLNGTARSLAELLDMPDADDVEFDPPRVELGIRPPDLS